MGDFISPTGCRKDSRIKIQLNRKQTNDKECNNPIVYRFLPYLLFCMLKTKRRTSRYPDRKREGGRRIVVE